MFLVAAYGGETPDCPGKLSVGGGSGGRDTVQPREPFWRVPGADIPPGESALVFISPLPVYTDRRSILDPTNSSG